MRRNLQTRGPLACLGAALLSACGSFTVTPATSGADGGSAVDCSRPRAAATRLRLLTETQYANTVLDVLQVGGSPAKGIGQKLDDTSLEQRATAAAGVAAKAAASLSTWAPCMPASGSAAACEQQIIERIGARLLRRPLADAERTGLTALFDAGVSAKDFATGVEWFLTGLLQSPDFMYEVVRPAATESAGEVRPLGGHEYASRLAYFIWDGPPDDALTAAAASGELADPTKRDAQVTRMIRDPRSSRGIAQFYRRWLKIDAFTELARNVTGFDHDVVSALATSLLMSGTQLHASPRPNIASLFSGDRYYLDGTLRRFYGIAGTGTGFEATAMPGQARRGILTHPAMMALMARPAETHPIGRGLFLLRNVLCKVVPVPPVAAIPQPPAGDGVSTRERLEAHTADAYCQACHAMINSAGFAFESFDQAGRYRTMDQGKPVDSHGALSIGKDTDGRFATGDELLARLADSKDLRSCFAEKYLDFALGRDVTDAADACSIQALGGSFGVSGDLEQLVASIAASDSFRLRLAEGTGR